MSEQQVVINPITVLEVVSSGGFWTRLAIAKALGRNKTSHLMTQIDIAVSLGYFRRAWGHDGTRQCWLYTVEQELF